MCEWPIPRPEDWLLRVNAPLTDAELTAVRRCAERGSPYGAPDWVEQTAKLLDLEHTLRTPGRPPKAG